MGYAFLWLEAMASALLGVAAVFSFSGRLKKWPALWPALMALLLSVLGIAATVFAGYLFFENIHPQWLFPYTLLWTLFFITGSWILILWGRRKTGEALIASSWSRSKIAGALVIALALQWSTLTALENAAKLEAAAYQVTALNRAQTVLSSPPSNDEDASNIYSQVKEEMGDIPEWLWNAATDPAFDPQSEKAQNLLRDKKKAIAWIKEAAQKPRLYHPLLVSYDFELQELTSFKNTARLLALEARTHARNGHIAAALENISDMNQIAGHLNQTPTLINVLVASVIHTEAKKILEIILAEKPTRTRINVPLPIKIDSSIEQSFRRGMVYENSFGASMFGDMVINDESSESPFLFLLEEDEIDLELKTFFWNHILAPLYRIFLFHEDRVSHEHFWERYHEYIKEPYYKSGIDLKEWEEYLNKNLDLGFFMSMNSSSFGVYFKRVTQQQTQFLLGRLGLATAAYRSDHGKYPKTLNSLTPKYIEEIPIDPFSGEPLKMIAVKDGLILYGVGPNLKDDQGAAFEMEDYDWDNTKGDIAFYLGSAFKEHRLKPAIEKMNNKEEE
jgi:hypothetical protein